MFKHKVFISYASEDAEIAQRLYDDLKNAGVELWLNRESITPGRDWKLEIDKALKESTIFLALISSKSTTKEGFTQRELKRALDVLDEKPEGDVFIIPIRVDDCPIFVRLQNYQWVDLFPSYSDGLEKLLSVLKPDFAVNSQETWERHDGNINDDNINVTNFDFDFEPKKETTLWQKVISSFQIVREKSVNVLKPYFTKKPQQTQGIDNDKENAANTKKEKPLWRKIISSFRIVTVALLLIIIFLSIFLIVLVIIAPPLFCNGICLGVIILLILIFALIFGADFKKQQLKESDLQS
jgi:hypothetical protein